MSTPFSRSQFTAGLWRNAPLRQAFFQPLRYIDHVERWQSYDPEATNGEWVLTQATAGTAALDTTRSGVMLLDSGSTTATQGVQIQRVKSPLVLEANASMWAEFPIKVVDTYDKIELFVGLSEIDTSILDTSANSSANHIGWQCVTDDGVLLFTSEKAGTGATKAAATLAEDTWIRLGFHYDADNDTLTQYVNGVKQAASLGHVTANIPKVVVYPSFVAQSGGTNDPILHVGPYRILQEWAGAA